MQARKQYLAEVRNEYERAGEADRSRLLDEAQKRTGYNRKYLIRMLNREPRPELVKRRRRKRKGEYGAAVTTALVEIWDIVEQPCGQRLATVLREQVERLRGLGEMRCSDAVAEQLKTISASTIDRLLRREKRVRMLRRNRNPNVQRLIYQKVPVKVASEWDTSEIGPTGGFRGALRTLHGRRLHLHDFDSRHCHELVGGASNSGTFTARYERRIEPDEAALSVPHSGTASGQRLGAGEQFAAGLVPRAADSAIAIAALPEE